MRREVASDGIFVRKVLVRETLVDNRDRAGFRIVVVLVKSASPDQRNG